MDMGSRDLKEDESLGLNCAWYADILMTLTAEAAPADVDATDAAQGQSPRMGDQRMEDTCPR